MKIPDQLGKKIYNRFVWFKHFIVGTIKLFWLLYLTLKHKKCYYGPFLGEFGHLLGHNLPLLAYLHARGVEIIFCGMEHYAPFFIDEKGEVILKFTFPVRDYFKEKTPSANRLEYLPKDVKQDLQQFITEAITSPYPFWDLRNNDFYFIAFRLWMHYFNFNRTIDFTKIYQTDDENSVVIFPRKKGASFTVNNGGPWDYEDLAHKVKTYFDKVYVIGHPAFSLPFESRDNIEVIITNNNRIILEKCANSKLIITQHSGTVYLGEYTNTPILMIYNGNPPIGNLTVTKYVKSKLGSKFPFNFAYSLDEIIAFVQAKFQQ